MRISEFFRTELNRRRIPCMESECGDFLISIGEHGELVRESVEIDGVTVVKTNIKFKRFISDTLKGKPLPFPLPAAIGMDALGYLIYKKLN